MAKASKEKAVAVAEKPVERSDFYRFKEHKKFGPVVETDLSGSNTQIFHLLYYTFEYHYGYGAAQTYRGKFPLGICVTAIDQIVEIANERGWDIDAFPYKDFIDDLRNKLVEIQASSLQRIARGEAIVEDLPIYFHAGSEVIVGRGINAWAGVVKSTELRRSMFANYFKLRIEVISNASGKLASATRDAYMGLWSGKQDLTEMEVRLISDEEKAQLTERGKLYRTFSAGSVYAQYNGFLIQPSYYSNREYRADGRVMIDVRAMSMTDPPTYRNIQSAFGQADRDDDDASESLTYVIEDGQEWRTSEYLFGFSFITKVWGAFKVSGLSEIKFRTDAFDKLVMDEETKEIVKALVINHGHSFEDIIDGKGGGCIFLLHGPPGGGKTLTAESVSELVKRPLYMISVGELGTDPDLLENRLRQILDLATTWNAVLLLDEADIFLEARDSRDVVRNAMVGVFLRLLEYHQGILFLTTNRAKNLDSAFLSRISLALKYRGAEWEKRRKIWSNLLDSAKIAMTGDEIDTLANFEVNGRQIKNSIRLGQTLAVSKSEPLNVQHFERTLRLNQDFVAELQEEDGK